MSLEQAKRELKARINRNQNGGVEGREERKGKKQLYEMLGSFISIVIDSNLKNQREIKESLDNIKIDTPVIPKTVVNIPKIDVPKVKIPEIKVNVPKIDVPKAEVEVKIPPIKLPTKDMVETNNLLKQIIEDINKPCQITLKLK